MHQRHRCAPRWDTFMGRGTLHSPNQPSNHCTVRAQRRFERHGIKVEITLVRSGDAKDAARGDVFKMKQMLLGARLPKGSGSTQARVRTSAPEVLKGAGSNGVRAGSSGRWLRFDSGQPRLPGRSPFEVPPQLQKTAYRYRPKLK